MKYLVTATGRFVYGPEEIEADTPTMAADVFANERDSITDGDTIYVAELALVDVFKADVTTSVEVRKRGS